MTKYLAIAMPGGIFKKISSFRDSHSLLCFVDPYGVKPIPGPLGSDIYFESLSPKEGSDGQEADIIDSPIFLT